MSQNVYRKPTYSAGGSRLIDCDGKELAAIKTSQGHSKTSMFMPHPNLSDEVNQGIVELEIEGGVFLKDLPPSTVLQIQTMHHCYTAVLLGGSGALISGHPEFCPRPVQVAIAGSTWGGSMVKLQFVGRGMHLEFHHPEYPTAIVTSPIQEIRITSASGS